MKKRYVAVVLCLLFAALLTGFFFWQRQNLQAFSQSVQYTPEELEEQMNENDKLLQEAVDSIHVPLREITDEERQALLEGTLDEDELAQQLVAPSAQQKEPAESTPQGSQNPSAEQVQPTEVSRIISKTYVMREKYVGALSALESAAISEYSALPKSERTRSAQIRLASKYAGKATSLEASCDAEMEAVIVQLENALKKSGQSTDLAQTVYDTYVHEKSLKKAWYLSKLKTRGLM